MEENVDLNGMLILLVEDDAFNQRFIKRSLENFKATVVLAGNGQEAIDVKELPEVDLILMDLQMPVMNGWECIQYLKTEQNLLTPIIALTGSELAEDREKAMALGCVDYLIKPLSGDALLQGITKAFSTAESKFEEKVEVPEEKTAQKELYSLSKLEEISRGNPDFVKKMVNMLLEEMPLSLTALEEALQQKKYDRVKAVAHKMKPSVNLMGMKSIAVTIQRIEDDSEAEINLESIAVRVKQVIDVCNTVLEELREEF